MHAFLYRFVHPLYILPVVDKRLTLYMQMQPVFFKVKAYFYIISIFKLLGLYHFGTFYFLIP